ncbi:septum formation family protein [Streptomyces litchfieldiae]|uniref:Septum formation family protein n=1 Tax=Streptomyces litchfieldiae TaxID=3075543 RepID=A0ABU2MYF5_9ACTN|nr:septum formation family protein [Streptomyces sp. DSM 44938]MDT0346546.1 septum formation family protein [Streptomyces sp. DSM 44938]
MTTPQPPDGRAPWAVPQGPTVPPPPPHASQQQPQQQPGYGFPPPPPQYGFPPPGAPAPHGQPPWPARPFSSMAVGSFVAALFLFPLGLVLGILALARMDVRAERGKGLAVAAVTVAAAQIVALSVIVPASMWDDHSGGRTTQAAPPPGELEEEPTEEPTEEPGAEGGTSLSVFDIEVGDCFDSGTGLDSFDEGGEEMTVTGLPCDEPHEAEAFGIAQVEGYDGFPGEDEMFTVANQECDALVQGYVLDTWTLPLDVQLFYYYPSAETWDLGDREILCFFGQVGGSDLTTSLRGDASSMNEDQLRYLEVTTPLEMTIWGEPLEEEDLAARQEWAGRMADSVSGEAAALAADEWPAEIDGLIGELIAAREASLVHWTNAGEASDPDVLGDEVETGYEVMGIDIEIEIRRELELSTGS